MSLEATYFLYAIFIALLKSQDLIRTLLRIVNLLPSLLLLLLEESDTVGQQLGVPLDTGHNCRLIICL